MKKPIVPLTTKTADIKAAIAAGDKIGALRIASRFFDRTPETKVFKRGWDAHSNPDFYRQIGKDPTSIVEAAYVALVAKFQ